MQTGKMGETATDLASAERDFVARAPWQWWRQQMPIAREWAYFDHAAVAPLSGPAARAMQRFAEQAAQQGDTVWPQWAAESDRLRGSIADWLGGDSKDFCLVPNTTTGINLVAEGWSWQTGDNVILPDGEFPSNLFPWQNQQTRGVEIRVIPRRSGRVLVDDLMDQVDSSTRLIAVSWVGYASGYRLDIADLVQRAHARGVLVLLDAIQGLGIFPLDLGQVPVDFLSADGHKWLLGPEGAGVAMIARQHVDKIRCGNVGWASVKNSHDYAHPSLQLREGASRFESGSANMIGNAALAASLDLFWEIRRTHGDRAIENRILSLVRDLDDRLREAGAETRLPTDPNRQSGILTFDVPGFTPAEVRRRAMKEQVVLSCRDGGVRASVHAYNNHDDLERLVSVVRSLT